MPKKDWSQAKVLLTIFFDKDGVVHHKSPLEAHIVIIEYCLEVFNCFHDAMIVNS